MQNDMDAPSPGGFLIVDDVAINIYITQEMLLPYGLPVDTADSGAAAIDKIKNGNEYDIIFMDHMMPGISGPEATEIIRSMGYMGCIVALTANSSELNSRMYVASGFNRFIVKPIDKQQLDDLVSEFVDVDFTADDDAYEEYGTPPAAAGAPAAAGFFTASAAAMQPKIPAEVEKLFIEDAESAIAVLEDLYTPPRTLSGEEKDLYEITVHGIKSALRNIGMNDLSDFALSLERAAASGDTAAMDAGTPELIDKLKNTINGLLTL